jgi:hypothetical protein
LKSRDRGATHSAKVKLRESLPLVVFPREFIEGHHQPHTLESFVGLTIDSRIHRISIFYKSPKKVRKTARFQVFKQREEAGRGVNTNQTAAFNSSDEQ